jgi:glycosyltransferase involved in cell wall biosynthesis
MPDYVRRIPAFERKLAGAACRLYARVICVGPEIRDAVISLGIPPERTEIASAYLGIERQEISFDPTFRLWIEQHRPVLSAALFFRPEYGFDLLLKSFIQLRRRHPALGCVVMGGGEQYDHAMQQVREAGLQDDLLLLGDVDHASCLAMICISDVFLRPTFADGDSISVREALALGVPVVASRVGSRPPGAMLFEPGDINDMLSKVELAWEETHVSA